MAEDVRENASLIRVPILEVKIFRNLRLEDPELSGASHLNGRANVDNLGKQMKV